MILLGFGLGLLAGTLTAGLYYARRIYTRQLDLPEWINDGNEQ